MKKPAQHLIAEVPCRQPRIAMTIGIDLGDVWSHYCTLNYCDGVYSGFTDAHLNDPDFWGARTNKMFILTQVANPDALHYGNLVTDLRLNGLVPSGGWF